MGPDKKKIAAACYARGTAAMAKEDWDFAVEMYTQCVKLVPDNLMYRQVLRGAEYRKYGNNKSGARFSGPKLMGVRSKIGMAKRQQNWEQIDLEAERGLQVNPWDAGLNADVAEACRERGFDEVAVFSYEKAIESDPENKTYWRSLAEVLEERGEYDRAGRTYQKIATLDPTDHEARRKVSEMMTKKVIDHSFEEKKSTKEVAAQTAYDFDRKSGAPKTDSVAPGESLEQDLKHAIRKDPTGKDNYLKLAELYKREDRLDEAMEQIAKAVEISGGDPNLREQMEDVELQRMKKQVDVAAERSQAAPDDEAAKQKAAALKTEFYKREIAVLAARVERYPKNLRLKFDLGQRYMKFKKWDLAIPLLQAASADSRVEADARILLGECFLNDNKKPLASRQFESAVKLVNQHDQPDLYLKCHYVLGRLAEEKADADGAINHYSEVLSLDYNYRDTRARLERLQGG